MSASLWMPVPLGLILSRRREEVVIENDCRYKRLTIRLEHKGVDLRDEVNGTAIGTKRQFRVHEGQFILSKIDARNGAFGVVPASCEGGVITGNFWTFDPDNSLLDPHFFRYFSRTREFIDFCIRASSGSTNRRYLQENRFLAQELRLPPVDEQKRLVARLDKLSEMTREALSFAHLADQGHSRAISACAGEHFVRLNQNFSEVALGDLNPHVTSGPRNWSHHYTDDGIRFYRAQDIAASGTIDDSNRQFVSPPDGNQGRTAFLEDGDLMIVITGATVGRVASYDSALEPGLVSQHVAICRLPKARILPRFAWWGLRSPQGQEQLLGQRYGQGKPGLNLTNIKSLRLPLPPLDIQAATVEALDALAGKLNHVQDARRARTAKLNALMPSILDLAFQGKL